MQQHEYVEQNRRAWDEIAEPRRAKHAPARFFRAGKVTLYDYELAALGDVRGKRVLHLQCASGSAVTSFAALGAHAVGVDISEVGIRIAREITEEAGLEATFVASDVYRLPPELQAGDFDLVYTGIGALCWLPDIAAWARIVARALRPGGMLFLDEHHPVRDCLRIEDGRLEAGISDYFSRGTPTHSKGGLGRVACGAESSEDFFSFTWGVGDVVTAVARAGMRIDALVERPHDPPYWWGEASEDVKQRVRGLPGAYVLTATKE